MNRQDEQGTEERKRRALFPGFASDEEYEEAVGNLRRYLLMLRRWEDAELYVAKPEERDLN